MEGDIADGENWFDDSGRAASKRWPRLLTAGLATTGAEILLGLALWLGLNGAGPFDRTGYALTGLVGGGLYGLLVSYQGWFERPTDVKLFALKFFLGVTALIYAIIYLFEPSSLKLLYYNG